jgi:hypothetical protein
VNMWDEHGPGHSGPTREVRVTDDVERWELTQDKGALGPSNSIQHVRSEFVVRVGEKQLRNQKCGSRRIMKVA